MSAKDIVKIIINEKLDSLVFNYNESVACSYDTTVGTVNIYKGQLINKTLYGESSVIYNNKKLNVVNTYDSITVDSAYIDYNTGEIYVGLSESVGSITVSVNYWSYTPYNNYATNDYIIERQICNAIVLVESDLGQTIEYTSEDNRCVENVSDTKILYLIAYQTAINVLRQWLLDVLKSGGIVNMASGRIRMNTTSIPQVVDYIIRDLRDIYDKILVSIVSGNERDMAGLA